MKCILLRHNAHPFAVATMVCLWIATVAAPVVLFAQRIDTIRTNPDAVLLRRIWTQRGNGIGNAVTALPDLDGDGRDEFAAAELRGDWRIYSMDSIGATRTLWQVPSESPLPLVHGTRLAGESSMIVRVRERDTFALATLYDLDFYPIDSGRIAVSPSLHWHSRTNDARLIAPRFHTADLDLDGADEFIIAVPNVVRDSVTTRNGEIWIYRGGAEFQMDTPTVVIRDTAYHGGGFDLHIGRIDADEYPDLVTITRAGGRIRWGGARIEAFDRPADRAFGTVNRFLDLLDADGDGQDDFLWLGPFLHLSSSGKDPRTRAYHGGDADIQFVGPGNSVFVAGPLNDSADRYDMFGLMAVQGDYVDLFFSGRHLGPDARYDAIYSTSRDGLGNGAVTQNTASAGDVDGNGWRDLLAGDDRFGGGGIAVILDGGTYIPRDSMPASAVRDITLDGQRDAITVWPNPASTAFHISWRGDLSRTPARFTVHDALGELIAAGETRPGRGDVLWSCSGRPAGVYLLSIFDRDGEPIIIVPVLKY
jgi:hypothetical protein